MFVAHTAPVSARDVRWTYRKGCPVGPDQLVQVRMIHRTYGGEYAWGTMVMARTARTRITAAFRRGFETGFRIHHMSTNERYRGSDPAAMAANNTSAFNCRRVTGNPYSLSPHAYGTAVDINTVQNPYQDSSGRWWPRRDGWLDRGRQHPGMIKGSTPIRVAFGQYGFQWGGYWAHPDWQHFDPAGRYRPRRTVAGTGPERWLPERLGDGLTPVLASGGHETGPVTPERVRDALTFSCGTWPTTGVPGRVAQQGYGELGGTAQRQVLVMDFTSSADAGRVAAWARACDARGALPQSVELVTGRTLRLTSR